LSQNRKRSYLGGKEWREDATEGSVGLLLPKSDHRARNW